MTWWFDIHMYWEMITTIRSEINFSLKSSSAAKYVFKCTKGKAWRQVMNDAAVFLQRNYTWSKEKRIQTPTWARHIPEHKRLQRRAERPKASCKQDQVPSQHKSLFVKATPKPHCYKWGSASAFTTNTETEVVKNLRVLHQQYVRQESLYIHWTHIAGLLTPLKGQSGGSQLPERERIP